MSSELTVFLKGVVSRADFFGGLSQEFVLDDHYKNTAFVNTEIPDWRQRSFNLLDPTNFPSDYDSYVVSDTDDEDDEVTILKGTTVFFDTGMFFPANYRALTSEILGPDWVAVHLHPFHEEHQVIADFILARFPGIIEKALIFPDDFWRRYPEYAPDPDEESVHVINHTTDLDAIVAKLERKQLAFEANPFWQALKQVRERAWADKSEETQRLLEAAVQAYEENPVRHDRESL